MIMLNEKLWNIKEIINLRINTCTFFGYAMQQKPLYVV